MKGFKELNEYVGGLTLTVKEHGELVRKAREDLVQEFMLLVKECIQKGLATEMIELDAIPTLVKRHNLNMMDAFQRHLDSITKDKEMELDNAFIEDAKGLKEASDNVQKFRRERWAKCLKKANGNKEKAKELYSKDKDCELYN